MTRASAFEPRVFSSDGHGRFFFFRSLQQTPAANQGGFLSGSVVRQQVGQCQVLMSVRITVFHWSISCSVQGYYYSHCLTHFQFPPAPYNAAIYAVESS